MSATRTMRRKILSPFANNVIVKRREPTDDITEADIEWLACAAASRVFMMAVYCGYDMDDLASNALRQTHYCITMWDRERCPQAYKASQWIIGNTIRMLRGRIKDHVAKCKRRGHKTVKFSELHKCTSESYDNSVAASNYLSRDYRKLILSLHMTSSGTNAIIDVVDDNDEQSDCDKQQVLDNLRKLGVKSEKHRDWIYQHYYEGKAFNQIAKEYGCTPWNVGSQINREVARIDKEKALEVLA